MYFNGKCASHKKNMGYLHTGSHKKSLCIPWGKLLGYLRYTCCIKTHKRNVYFKDLGMLPRLYMLTLHVRR